jgi:RNA polymerase sigma-70 factor (ECF subfamily)
LNDLRESLRKGDRDVFRVLADQYGERLYNAGLALCRDHFGAQDLVQETFAEALRSASRFEGRSAPYTWLYGILRRRFLLSCRKKRRFLRILPLIGHEARASKSEEISETGHSPDPLMAAVMRLPAKYREILFLRYIEIHSVAEIAALTAVPEGTVKSRLHYALRRLKTITGSEPHLAGLPAVEKIDEL